MSAARRAVLAAGLGLGLLASAAGREGAGVLPGWRAAGAGGAQAAAEAVSDYYPLAEGQSREYATREADGRTGQLTETVSGTRDIDGVRATRLAISDGSEAYVTLDEAGLRIQGELGLRLGFISYRPPILLLAAQFRAGDRFVTRTTATLADGTLPIEATAEVVGFEDVTVPGGRFPRAARVRLTTRAGTVASVAEIWLARGVGEVKGIDGLQRESELSATSYPTLTLFTDRAAYRPGEPLDLAATVTGSFRVTDAYLVLRRPDGSFLQLGRQGLRPVGPEGFRPAVAGFPLVPYSGLVFRSAFDGAGDYTWLGVLTRPGGDASDARTYASNVAFAAFRVAGAGA
jgi:hypothetical protein